MLGKSHDALASENERLRSLLSDSTALLPQDWRLTPTEESIFRALLARDCVTVALIAEVAGTTPQSARVHIHRIRQKLKPRAVEIETVTGKGWRLIGREHWARQLAAPASMEGTN
jgi:DNA-binding response OmpR family regulator